MAIKGYRFIKAKDKSRLELISDYIWSLDFTKDRPVHIDYNETVTEISAKLTSVRYLITVRPDSELEEIKNLLLKKGYIKADVKQEAKILKIIDDEEAILKLSTIDKKELVLGMEFLDHIALKFIELFKAGLSDSKVSSIEISECYTTRKIKIEINGEKLFVNGNRISGNLMDIAKQIVKDIELNIRAWALFYYGNLHSVEELAEKDWYSIHVKELEKELNELKSMLS